MQITDATKFPCGCRIATVDGSFVMEPCSPTCEVFAYAVEESRKQGKPIAQLDLSGEPGKLPFAAHCPFCGKTTDGFSSADRDKKPGPGDFGLCAYCHRVGVYTDNGIRKPTESEQAEIDGNQDIVALREAAKLVIQRGP